MLSILEKLKEDLKKYGELYPAEKETVGRFLRLINVEDSEKTLTRTYFSDGHITTSALILNPGKTKMLLTHHKFLNLWLQLGGHFEKDPSLLDSAIRESKEESGIDEILPLSSEFIDLDIHEIPPNLKKGEPAHYHYDIRFLLQAKSEGLVVSDESNDLKWVDISKEEKLFNYNIRRLIEKGIPSNIPL